MTDDERIRAFLETVTYVGPIGDWRALPEDDPDEVEDLRGAYSKDQPRVPAGQGDPSGEWTKEGGAMAPREGVRPVIEHLTDRMRQNALAWQDTTGHTREVMAARVRAFYQRATEAQRRAGAQWYPDARLAAERLATEYGVTTDQAAGVIAALSPLREWSENLQDAQNVLRSVVQGEAVPDVQKLFSANVNKAVDMLRGAPPADVLWRGEGGFKVRSFYANIAHPERPEVTIDTHILRILLGDNSIASKEHGKYASNAGRYEAFRQAFVDVATEFGVSPASVQATVWVVQKAEQTRQTVGYRVKAASAQIDDREMALLLDAVRVVFQLSDEPRGLYSKDQPRVPAGSGDPSGEWTKEGGSSPRSILGDRQPKWRTQPPLAKRDPTVAPPWVQKRIERDYAKDYRAGTPPTIEPAQMIKSRAGGIVERYRTIGWFVSRPGDTDGLFYISRGDGRAQQSGYRQPRDKFAFLAEGRALYSKDQPRDPAGTETGGQWTDGGGGAKTPTAIPAARLAAVAANNRERYDALLVAMGDDPSQQDMDKFYAASSHALQALVDHAQPYLRVPYDQIGQILTDGRVKSQHETLHSGGALDPQFRQNLEDRLFGSGRPCPPCPIYGYLATDDRAAIETWTSVDPYGDVTIALKPRRDTTITFGDSFGAPGFGDDPGAFTPMSVTHVDARAYKPRFNRASGFTSLQRSNPETWRTLEDSHRAVDYVEAQFHQGVSLADIREVIFRGFPSDFVQAALKQHGIPWRYERDVVAPQRAASEAVPSGTVVATRGPGIWLVKDGDQGYVVDDARGVFGPLLFQSILARGYWTAVEPRALYSKDQPRDPAGTETGGQWTDGAGIRPDRDAASDQNNERLSNLFQEVEDEGRPQFTEDDSEDEAAYDEAVTENETRLIQEASDYIGHQMALTLGRNESTGEREAEFASEVIRQWSWSPPGTSKPINIGMQHASAREFDLPDASLAVVPASAPGPAPDSAWADAYTRAEYRATQAWLADHEITGYVTLYRGVEGKTVKLSEGYQPVMMRPVTSWSLDDEQAHNFAGDAAPGAHPAILVARVPVGRILSIPMTGRGSLSEREVVLIGGTAVVNVHPAWGAWKPPISANAAKVVPNIDADATDADWLRRKLRALYSKDQPRVPAGQGDVSGEWTKGQGGSVAQPLHRIAPRDHGPAQAAIDADPDSAYRKAEAAIAAAMGLDPTPDNSAITVGRNPVDVRAAFVVADVLAEMRAKGYRMPERVRVVSTFDDHPSGVTDVVNMDRRRSGLKLQINLPDTLPPQADLDNAVAVAFGGTQARQDVSLKGDGPVDQFAVKNFKDVVVHEMGHVQDRWHWRHSIDQLIRMKEQVPSDADQNVMASVSVYASSARAEFIAEAFTRLYRGETLTPAAMRLYRRYKGPVIK